MARSLVLFVVGAGTGAAAVFGALAFLGDAASSLAGSESVAPRLASDASTAAAGPNDTGSAERLTAASGFAAARLVAFTTAAALDDSFELEARIERAAAPSSPQRDIELEALLARLAEIEPRRAVAIARSLRLSTRLLVPVFETWAAADAAAAIAGLQTIVQPAALRTLALAVLETLGNDAPNLERVAAALPATDRFAFVADALGQRALRDLRGALEAALALDTLIEQRVAMQRVAEIAGDGDPRAALAHADIIKDSSLRSLYTRRILSAWTRTDALAALEFIETVGADLPNATTVFTTLAESEPERMLAMVDRVPSEVRSTVQTTALYTLAQTDPLAVIARLDGMPPGADRDNLLRMVAHPYGRYAPDAALTWAKAQTNVSRDLVASVLRGIASVDLDRALEMVIADFDNLEAPSLVSTASFVAPNLLTMLVTRGAEDYARIADRLLTIEQPRIKAMAGSLIANWSREDPSAAVLWALNNTATLDENAISSLAQQVGSTDAALARRTVEQLPQELRTGWLRGAASGIANTDTAAALRFIEAYRGEPGFDAGYAAVVTRIGQSDPPVAARMLSSLPAPSASAVLTTVSTWVQRDAAAAAEWARTVRDPRVQQQSVSIAVGQWARNDAEAAQRWAIGLPRGPLRDAALTSFLSSTIAGGGLDARALAAYSSDTARQQGVSQVIVQLGRSNVEQARNLVAAHLTDPDLRRSAEEQLARSGGTGGFRGGISEVIINSVFR